MEANEAHELQEHAEHGAHEASLRPAALTMTILAVLVAIVSVLGQRCNTAVILNQDKATDQWGEYQAKKNRAYDTQLTLDLLKVLPVADKEATAKLASGYKEHQTKWTDDLNEVQEKAKGFEEKVEQAETQAKFFELGEVLLEIGLVVTSVTLLTRRRVYWYFGMAFSAAGIVSAVAVFFLH
jgi:hypothetical protein